MKAYNGFSGDLRATAQRWLNAEIASGRLTRPKLCMACGQETPPVDMHAEDYSMPFAAGKTDEFHLCFACHMAVHCRFKNPAAWDAYRLMVAKGGRMVALGRNFPLFIQRFTGMSWTTPSLPEIFNWQRPATWVTVRPLDEIDGWLLQHTGKGWR